MSEIQFATRKTPLGEVLVACRAGGVCAILLGDGPDELISDLQRRFPRAQLSAADLDDWLAPIGAYLEDPALGLDLPLVLDGTPFQMQVWQALQAVPVGATTTYAALAQQIGAPKAVRAVAQACGANRLALAIPCHRVLRSDGGLSGYRWGVARKQEILAREAKACGSRG